MRVVRTATTASLAAVTLASVSNVRAMSAVQTMPAAPSTDFVAIYYDRHQQQQQQQNLTPQGQDSALAPVVFKQSVPVEVQARLKPYALAFADLPELLKRALLWESGYSLGDSASLAQIYTLCGSSMADIALSETSFASTACQVSICKSSDANRDWRYSTACRPDQLLPAAKCASTAVNTVSSTPLWSSAAWNATASGRAPDLQVRRHKYTGADALQPAHVYAIHTSASDANIALACRSGPDASALVAIPCVPYQRTDARWCRPAQSSLMTTWLDAYTKTQQGRHVEHALGAANATAATTRNSMHGLDVTNATIAAAVAHTKDQHGVYVNAAFAFDGTSSDLTQQFYRRYLAGDTTADTTSKLIVQEPLPKEIEQRLADASLQFDDLPPLLQRALVWDSGYVVANASSSVGPMTLVPVSVRCGLAMSDLAVPRESVEQLVGSSCSLSNCSTANSSRHALECVDDTLASKSLCAVAPATLSSNSSSDSNTTLSLWADGGDDALVPAVSIRRHAWQSSGSAYEMFSIATVASPSESAPASKCPAMASMTIPCAAVASRGDDAAQIWCRPRSGALVTSWLRQVAKQKEFSLLYLVPILAAVALALTGLAVYIRRKTFKRFDPKFDSSGARSNTIATIPDGTYIPGRLSLSQHRGSGIVVDARLSALSPSSSPSASIESFAAFSSNHVLHTLVNHPSLRFQTVAYDQVQFLTLLSAKGSLGPEIWLGSVRSSHVAIKRLSRARKAEYDELEDFMREITLHATVTHPNLVQFVGVAWTTLQNLCLLTEYVDGGDLPLYLKQHSLQLAWERSKMHIAMGIANAICCLHQQQPMIVHGNISSKNVLLTNEFDAKLINVGARAQRADSLAFDDALSAASATAAFWTAPEVLRGEAQSEKADMYAFGMVLAELDTHQAPFTELKSMTTGLSLEPHEILQHVASGELTPATSPFCPLEVAELITACLNLDPQQRPSASDAVVVLAKVPIAIVGIKTYSF